jgi:tetratricopeptide (TPR) repeat protein
MQLYRYASRLTPVSEAAMDLSTLASLAQQPREASSDRRELLAHFENSPRQLDHFGPAWSQLGFRLAREACVEFPSTSLEILRRCDMSMAADPFFLHTFATLATRLLSGAPSAASSARRNEWIFASIGAWSAFCGNADALSCFASRRYSVFGVSKSPPPASTIQEFVDVKLSEWLSGLEPPGWRPGELRLMLDAEKEAVSTTASLSGIPTGEGGQFATFGPLFSVSVGTQTEARRLVDEASRQDRMAGPLSEMRQLAALLGLDLDSSPQASDRLDRRRRELARSFSPLAVPAAQMAQHRFGEADSALAAAPRDASTPAEVALASFMNREKHGAWLESERRRMKVECHIENSKELVAHVPIDLSEVASEWKRTLVVAREASMEADARRLIGAIAVGRATLLFEGRTREARIADKGDSRTTAVRRTEAVGLLETAWETTRDERVQGSLTEYLNVQAVELANKDKFDESIRILMRALRIKPNARQAAENLAQVVLAHAGKNLGGYSDAAGQFLQKRIEEIRALDPRGSQEEIAKCARAIADNGSTPFFNCSCEAAVRDDWDEASRLMIWTLKLASHDPVVINGAFGLILGLQQQVSQGNWRCTVWRDSILKHLPYALQDGLGVADMIGHVAMRMR